MKNKAIDKLFNGWKDAPSGFRKLNDKEKKDWKEFALTIQDHIKDMTDEELVEFFEGAMCDMESQEISVIVAEWELVKRAKKQRIHFRILNALPTRKAIEAVKLAFPRYKENFLNLF